MIDLETRREIDDLLIRYATAVDARDLDLLESCFTEDVQADYPGMFGKLVSRKALLEALGAMLDACGPTLHYISNVQAREEGPEIRSRCYTQAVVMLPGQDAPVRTAGTYEDRLVKTGDGWRISERSYVALA